MNAESQLSHRVVVYHAVYTEHFCQIISHAQRWKKNNNNRDIILCRSNLFSKRPRIIIITTIWRNQSDPEIHRYAIRQNPSWIHDRWRTQPLWRRVIYALVGYWINSKPGWTGPRELTVLFSCRLVFQSVRRPPPERRVKRENDFLESKKSSIIVTTCPVLNVSGRTYFDILRKCAFGSFPFSSWRPSSLRSREYCGSYARPRPGRFGRRFHLQIGLWNEKHDWKIKSCESRAFSTINIRCGGRRITAEHWKYTYVYGSKR